MQSAQTRWESSHRTGSVPDESSSASLRHKRRRVLGRQSGHGLLFLSPFIVAFAAFTLWPNINSLIISFQHYEGYGEPSWVGFDNYLALLQYGGFWSELANTLEYWALHIAILIPLAFLLAVLVTSKRVRGQRIWQALIFLPQVMSIVAVTLVFQVLFSQHSGIVNAILGLNVAWLTDFGIARWIVVLLLVWQGLGFWFVVFIAGLSSIDPEINEAATIDGAGPWQRLRLITVPLMRNIVLFAVVISTIHSMALYTQPNVLLGTPAASAPPAVAPLSNLVVSNLQSGSFGQSAAAGWMLFVLTIVVSALIFGVNRVWGGSRND